MARRYFLACFILTSSLVAGQSLRHELRGQKVNLKPDITGQPDSILWKRNGNKVVEFNGQEQDVYGQYANRISLDWHTAELNITDLRFEDSGDYELEVYMNKQLSVSLHTLEVIDKVAKPTISCEMNDGGGSNKSGALLCSVEPRQPQSLMRVEWRSHGNVQPGRRLTISLGDKYDDEEYSCWVSNPLSEETATFTAKDCYPVNNSVLIGIPVTVAILLSLLLLGLGLGIFFLKQRHKACFAKGNRPDPENPTHPCETTGSVENTADERRRLIDRTPTIPSTQRLIQEHDRDLQDEDEKPEEGHIRNKINHFESICRGEISPSAGSLRNKAKNKRPVCPPTSPRNESPPHLELNHLAINDKGDAEDQLRKSAETEVPPELESSTAAEQSESVKETAEDDENRPPVDTTPTPPSTQPLDHLGDPDAVKDSEKSKDEHEETGSPPSSPRSESPSPLDPSNLASNNKGDADADADQLYKPADSENENETKPAAESTNTMSDLESSTASEHQEKSKDEHEETGSPPSSPRNLEKDEDEEGKSHPANADTPVPKPRSQLAQNSPNMTPEVTTGGQKEDATLDEVNGETDTSGVGETNESGASSEDKQLSPVSEQKDSETTRHDQDPNLSQSETYTESDKKTAEDDENRPPVDTTLTPPSTQPLDHLGDPDAVKDSEKSKDEHEETGSPPSSPRNLEKDEDEEGKSHPANADTPVPKPRSQLAQNSPNMTPEVTTGGQKEDATLDEVSGETDTSGVGETNESGASSEDEQLSPVSEQKDSETTRHDQDPNLSQSETHTGEDNQQEMDQPVPAAEKDSGSEDNSEETDLYSAPSDQPQSPTPTKPDNRSTNTFQESPDNAHKEPGQDGEGKTTKESDESGESEDDTVEDKK